VNLQISYRQVKFMKKRKLEAEFDYDFSLCGIISTLKEYKLAWMINSQFDLQLDKAKDIEIEFLKSPNLIISNYVYETEHCCFRLLKNKSVDLFGDSLAFLIPELNHFDYLLILQGFEDSFTNEELKKKMASFSGIQYLQFFQIENLKSKENLIF